MPKYTYHCGECQSTYVLTHSMNELHLICEKCGSDKNLNKIPVSFSMSKTSRNETKVGSVVKDAIESSKNELEEQKTNLKNRTYDV